MQILEIIGLFAGLALAVALSLVVLLRSAEALSWRHEDGHPVGAEPAAAPEPVIAVPAQRTGPVVSHRTITTG
jgi:hypothetical protein